MSGLRDKLASLLLGSAQANQGPRPIDGVTALKLHPVWQQQYNEAQMNGQPFPQFEEWAQGYLNQQPEGQPNALLNRQ
jgi:hypothetical protein